MKPIKVTPKNADAIKTALAEVNGRASSLTITTYETVEAFATEATRELSEFLPKKVWKGARAICKPAGPSSSYNNRAVSTEITLNFRASGVFLSAVKRSEVSPRDPKRMRLVMTPVQLAVARMRFDNLLEKYAPSEAKDMSSHEKIRVERDARALLS
ncbi:MAG: hypothetical protein ACP5EN_09115 [Rhodovulum sp.]